MEYQELIGSTSTQFVVKPRFQASRDTAEAGKLHTTRKFVKLVPWIAVVVVTSCGVRGGAVDSGAAVVVLWLEVEFVVKSRWKSWLNWCCGGGVRGGVRQTGAVDSGGAVEFAKLVTS